MKIPPLSIVVCVASCALATMGTKACQEDYDLGSQTTISTATASTATVTATPTIKGTTVTVTVSVSPSVTVSGSVSPTVSVSVSPTVTVSPSIKPSASAKTPVPTKVTTLASSMLVAPLNNVNNDGGGGNWLGKAFSEYGKNGKDNQDDDEDENSIVPESRVWVDSDGDGFSDDFESEHGSAVYGAGSTPQLAVGSDRWNYLSVDVDEDGCPDALRSIIDESGATGDSDGDCLPDIFETQQGLVAESSDSDFDLVPDGLEVLAGSSSHRVDTDGDGISDYQELRLGLDPRLPNFTEDK